MTSRIAPNNYFNYCLPETRNIIFHYLPVHNVAMLSLVCKSWAKQISAQSFVVSKALSRVEQLVSSPKETSESHFNMDPLQVSAVQLSRISNVFYCRNLGENGTFHWTDNTPAINTTPAIIRAEMPPNHGYIGSVGDYFLTSHDYPRRVNIDENYEFNLYHRHSRKVLQFIHPFSGHQTLEFWRNDTISFCGNLGSNTESEEKLEKVDRFWTLSKKGLLSQWEMVAERIVNLSNTRIGAHRIGRAHDVEIYAHDITVERAHQAGDVLYAVMEDVLRGESRYFTEYHNLSDSRKMAIEMPKPDELERTPSYHEHLASLAKSSPSIDRIAESPRMKKKEGLPKRKNDEVSPTIDYSRVWRSAGVPHSQLESLQFIETNESQIFYYGTKSVSAFAEKLIEPTLTMRESTSTISHVWTIRMEHYEQIEPTFTKFGNKWVLLHLISSKNRISKEGFRILHASNGEKIRSIFFVNKFKAWLLDDADMVAYQDSFDMFYIIDIQTGKPVHKQHIPHTIQKVKCEIDDKGISVSLVYSKISIKGTKHTGLIAIKFLAAAA